MRALFLGRQDLVGMEGHPLKVIDEIYELRGHALLAGWHLVMINGTSTWNYSSRRLFSPHEVYSGPTYALRCRCGPLFIIRGSGLGTVPR